MKSIRDNYSNGSVGEFLKENTMDNSDLSFVTAYFIIYAYKKLKPQLDSVKSLRLLFGEPRFIKSVASSTDAKSYKLEDEENTSMKQMLPASRILKQTFTILRFGKSCLPFNNMGSGEQSTRL